MRPRAKCFLFPLFAAAAGSVHATDYCVADTQSFKAALLDASAKASAFPDQSAVIQMVRRPAPYQIDTDITLESMHFDSLAMRGGFDAGCVTRSHDSSQTTVEFLGATRFDVRDRFELSGLTAHLDEALFVVPSASAEVVIESNFLTLVGNDTEVVHLRRDTDMDDYSFTFSVVNNVITTLDGLDPGPGGDAACALLVYNGFTGGAGGVGGQGTADILNNTIARTGGSGVCLSRVTNAVLANNIIQDATTASVRDKDDDKSSVVLYHNFLEYPHLGLQPSIELATKSTSPNFVDPNGDFRLQQASAAVNSGWGGALDKVPEFDLDGNPRKGVGTAIDHGAFENPFDDYTAPMLVTSNADSGAGTLRQAILDANASTGTPQRIVFDLGPGPADCGPAKAIELETALPDVTDDLEIDGYGGLATVNKASFGFDASLCVVLRDKSGGASVTTGLTVPASATDVTLKVRGVHFTNFSSSAIGLFGGAGHMIQGNRFGGGVLASNGRAINVAAGVTGVLIGGSDRASRNMVSTSNLSGIQLAGNGNTVVNNLVGPGVDGLGDAASRNSTGIVVSGASNFIERNTISGNLSNGVQIQGNGNFLRNNLIGINDGKRCAVAGPCTDANLAQGNSRGVLVLGSNNVIQENEIAYNANQGVAVTDNANGNRIRANRFRYNGSLGIDLRNDGAVASLAGTEFEEPANASNRGQNHPVLMSASGTSSDGMVSGTLQGRNGTYTIEVFASAYPDGCDANGHGEGNYHVGTGLATISNAQLPFNGSAGVNGTATFTVPVHQDFANLVGKQITATATSSSGDTSEFSACQAFLPTNTAPSFNDSHVVIDRNTPANTSIALLHATDDGLPANPGSITFTLPTAGVPFVLSATGELTVTQAGIFDVAAGYTLDVKVDDGEKSVTGTVTVRPSDLFRDGFEDPAP